MFLKNETENNLICKMILFLVIKYDIRITSVIELIMLLSVSSDIDALGYGYKYLHPVRSGKIEFI